MDFFNKTSGDLLGVKPSYPKRKYYNVGGVSLPASPVNISPISISATDSSGAKATPAPITGISGNSVSAPAPAASDNQAPVQVPSGTIITNAGTDQPANTGSDSTTVKHKKHFLFIGLLVITTIALLAKK